MLFSFLLFSLQLLSLLPLSILLLKFLLPTLLNRKGISPGLLDKSSFLL